MVTSRGHHADVQEVPQAQAQAALEEDHGDRHRYDREQQIAQQLVRVYELSDRPQDEAGDEQQQDRRQPQPPGQPLRADASGQDPCQPDQYFFCCQTLTVRCPGLHLT